MSDTPTCKGIIEPFAGVTFVVSPALPTPGNEDSEPIHVVRIGNTAYISQEAHDSWMKRITP